ncbi:M67 family metallopeptidase [Deinococcus arenicola]|uniref:M67 family metallopeptidase n=1 Tax=Deinococcus arenicola TaxID=2994950 RepID=A0ABU4DS74_9DEIO|nr:M67 family metallopeptidase [Deinococcus sp. ZS9-10]MDV6375282.1 M67 family metallopeptidase [Deinococcus sp. ZS9-10]
MRGVSLILPAVLADALWAHAVRESPRECVGALGGTGRTAENWNEEEARAVALYPLPNVAARPVSDYLADPIHLLWALKAMRTDGLALVALYHSHPHGPARPSPTDLRLAAYPVPYVIADVQRRVLRAYSLPQGTAVQVIVEGAEEHS